MTMCEKWIKAAIEVNTMYSKGDYNGKIISGNPINTDAYEKAEIRQQDRLLAKYGGRHVWRTIPVYRIKRPEIDIVQTSIAFEDGSQTSWAPSSLDPQDAAEYYGVENRVN
mgnify:FL=1